MKDVWSSGDYLTFVVIPSRWWLWGAWKLAWAIRSKTMSAVMRELNKPLGDTIQFPSLLR